MFFKSKSHDADFKRLEKQLHALTQAVTLETSRLDTLNQNISQPDAKNQNDSLTDTLNQNISQLNTLNQNISQLDTSLNKNISQLHTDVQKHNMAIEDLLDEWDEKKSDEASVRKSIQESEHTEQQLLQLFETYQEQFWNLKHFTASKDNSWTAQIALMEETLEHCRQSCQISMIQEYGIKVNYELHEVIEAIDTTDPALDKIIADVYRCGYLYKGTVRKKAQVSAYRLSI